MEMLKQLRKEKKLTQKELADVLGVSRYMINQYENGKREPSRKTIAKMSEYFNCPIGLLIEDCYTIDDLQESKEQSESVKTKIGQKRNRISLSEKETFIMKTELNGVFKFFSNLTNEEFYLLSLFSQLNDDEIQELTNYVDYIISKRK